MADRPRNPRGRPPPSRGEPSRSIHVRVSRTDYSKASARSERERQTLPEMMREALRRMLDDDHDD